MEKPTRPRAVQVQPVDTGDKVAFLGSPAAYPDGVSRVEVRETHMSWVFLAGDVVYKLKKPVRSAVLDFSTLEAREANCRTEVRLNLRLAPDIYDRVVALTREADGRLALDGAGEVVDWLVRMRRVPADRMLDRVIEDGTLSRADVERVADVLADFFRRATVAELAPEAYVARFVHEQTENRSILTMPEFDLPQAAVDTVLDALDGFIVAEADALGDRVRSGKVVEGHGDLRPEHVCLLEPPVVIDCLEFNRMLRLVDPFDELALLGLECERLGAAWLGDLLVARCADALGDRPPDRLIAFYIAFRAALRARLVLGHLLEPEPREPEKWAPLARQYLAIAQRAILRMVPRAGPRSTRPRDTA